MDYEHIGGLQRKSTRSAMRSSFRSCIHTHLSNYKLSAPKGVLLYQPSGCGKP